MVLASKDGSSGFDIKPQKLSPSSIACNGVLADESGCTKPEPAVLRCATTSPRYQS